MKAKRLFALVMTLVLVLGFNVTSAFAAEGVWTIDGIANEENGNSTNNVSWLGDTAADGNCWSFWSKEGSDEGAMISQTVTLEAGTYTLSFIYNGQGENIGSVTFYGFVGDQKGVEDATTGWVTQTLDAQADWGVYEATFDVAAGTYEVGVYANVTVANCWAQIDNISLKNASGVEQLVEGDFNFDDTEWATYVVSNVNGSSDSEATTAASGSNSNSATKAASSGTTSSTKTSTAAKTGDNTPIAMAAIAIIAASAVVVARKKKVTE